MTRPNLFSFATSELTQDAFLAYLLEWAAPSHAEADPEMHHAGTQFLHLLLSLHKLDISPVTKLEVRVQVQRIDVLAYLEMQSGKRVVLVIEDKVHAGSYNNLDEYIENGKSEYPDATFAGIYLRTGNQADYRAIEDKGFRIVNRTMMLDFLRATSTGNPRNTIFQNYKVYLEHYQHQLDAFKNTPVAEWDGNAWIGFFRQKLMTDNELRFGDYGYVANPSGGFQGAWWPDDQRPTFRGYPVYLQIDGSNTKDEDSRIAVKMGTVPGENASGEKIDRINLIRAFAEAIQRLPPTERCCLVRPGRLRAGKWMTAAWVTPAPELSPGHLPHSLQQLRNLQDLILKLSD